MRERGECARGSMFVRVCGNCMECRYYMQYAVQCTGYCMQGGEGRDCMQYAVHLCASLQTHGGREGGKERESACVRACVRVRARVREIQRQED